MSEPLDIIPQYNSLDDILSGTAGAITAVSGHVDDLRRAAVTSPRARDLLGSILDEVDSICFQVRRLKGQPDNATVRGNWVKTANYLHDLGEEALILLSELEG